MRSQRIQKKEKPQKEHAKSADKSAESVLLKNQLARALADYDNLRKRVDTERETWIAFSSERIIIKILPILDALEAAQEHLKDQGLAIVISEFKRVLQEEGIVEIRPKAGDEFNHSYHEAVESVKASGPADQKGKVAELVLTGWRYKTSGPESLGPAGRVIRHAKVKVFAEVTDKEEELEKEMARGDYM
jgi:molecular chaperone GrpE